MKVSIVNPAPCLSEAPAIMGEAVFEPGNESFLLYKTLLQKLNNFEK